MKEDELLKQGKNLLEQWNAPIGKIGFSLKANVPTELVDGDEVRISWDGYEFSGVVKEEGEMWVIKRSKASFWYYLINWKIFDVVKAREAMEYKFPDKDLSVKELWKWCKEGK